MNLLLLLFFATEGSALVITQDLLLNTSAIIDLLIQKVSDAEWDLFKKYYRKIYTDETEHIKRLSTYALTRQTIADHNENYRAGKTSYRMSINQFSDMTLEEVMACRTGLLSEYKVKQTEPTKSILSIIGFQGTINPTPLPDSVDWRQTCGNWPVVKDQRDCGSCWAYTVTTVLEYQLMIKTSTKILLSEQQLIDCSRAQGNKGCSGGLMTRAYSYIIENGIGSADSYPYINGEGQCKTNVTKIAEITGFKVMDNATEVQLKTILATYGPVAVAMDATSTVLSYDGGIFKDDNCKCEVNHAVTAVGYGCEGTTCYWIIKNSWGTTWGENGYMKMYMGNNHCGIQTLVSYPILKILSQGVTNNNATVK